MRTILWLVPVCLLVGCSNRMKFTTMEELRSLTQQPRPAKVFRNTAVDIAEYELSGPFEGEQASAWSGLLAAQAKLGRFQSDRALSCAAREEARFELEKKGDPAQPLKAFILGRCGALSTNAGSNSLSGDVPDTVSDQELFNRWQADVLKMIATLPPGSRAGLALVRFQGRAHLELLYQEPRVTLKPIAPFPDEEGRVIVEGVLDFTAARVEALINRGAIGWGECTADERVKLPAFRFTCVAEKSDPLAWLSVGAWEPDRLLGSEVVRALVWPSRAPSNKFVRPAYAEPGAPTAEIFVERLNGVRKRAGLSELTLARAQSATATSLAPFFFSEEDPKERDRMALGLMAGWEVDGLVMSGSFSGEWNPHADAGALLSSMLDSPDGRRDLLDPKVSRISAGMLTEGETAGVLVSTFTMAPALDPTAEPQKLIVALNEARAKVGKGPVKWMFNPTDFYVKAAALLRSNEWDTEKAGRVFMNETIAFTQRPLHGIWYTTYDLEKLKWSDDLLEHPAPEVLIFVGIHREEGDAWAEFVVLVVVLDGAPGTQA